MYDRRMLAVDLPTTVRVAMARNIDIQTAQEHVAASRGEYEASIGMIFPSIQPSITLADSEERSQRRPASLC